LGKKVRCKKCGHTFVARSESAPPAAREEVKPPDGKSRPTRAAEESKPASPQKTDPAPPAAKPDPIMERSAYGIVSDELAIKKIQDFQAKAEPSDDVVKGGDSAGKKVNPYGMTEVSLLPRCPHCAHEMPSEEAVICLNCGYNTQTRKHVGTKHTYEITPAEVAAWRMPGILCAIVALLGMIFIGFLWLAITRVIGDDNDSSFAFMGRIGFKIYGSLIVGFIVYFTASIAYNRLILNPRPPETEKRG
jgi:hypothetical protein